MMAKLAIWGSIFSLILIVFGGNQRVYGGNCLASTYNEFVDEVGRPFDTTKGGEWKMVEAMEVIDLTTPEENIFYQIRLVQVPDTADLPLAMYLGHHGPFSLEEADRLLSKQAFE